MSKPSQKQNIDLEKLSKVTLFKHWPRDALKSLLAETLYKQYEAGQIIYHEGEIPNFLYIILEGIAHERITLINGADILLSRHSNDDVFGEVGFLDGKPRETIIYAHSKAYIAQIRRTSFINKIEEINTKSWLDLVTLVSEKRRNILNILTDLIHADSTTVTISTLQRLLPHTDIGSKINITYDELAVMCGLSRITLSKTINNLINQKIIKKTKSGFELLNPSKLEEMLNDHKLLK